MGAVVQYGMVLYKMYGLRPPRPTDQKVRRKKSSSSRGLAAMDKASFVLFPTVSFALGAVYWVYYLNRKPHQ